MGSLSQVPAGSLPAHIWVFSASLVLGSSLCEEEGNMAAHGPVQPLTEYSTERLESHLLRIVKHI